MYDRSQSFKYKSLFGLRAYVCMYGSVEKGEVDSACERVKVLGKVCIFLKE